jgi:uncharacterized protein (TIGR02594 family)
MSPELRLISSGVDKYYRRRGFNLMRVNSKLVPAFCAAAVIALTSQALAKPSHRHRSVAATGTIETHVSPTDQDIFNRPVQQAATETAATGKTSRRSRRATRGRAVAQSGAPSLGSGDLVTEARRYIGGNPTGRGSLWCGAFMDMVLKHTGHNGGGNLARAYTHYGTRLSGPQVGAIAVMARGGGGHVGVVSGIDSSGNPIVISGNHNNTVAESVYPRGRIIAYVMPN